jgi:excisionase family DNA binding protein
LVAHENPRTEESTEYLMTVEELRRFLAVSRTYAYRMLRDGELPSVRLGRSLRIRKSDLQQFVEEHTEGGGADAA